MTGFQARLGAERESRSIWFHDRSAKLRKRKARMVVHGASLKNPDIQRALLSGRRKRKR